MKILRMIALAWGFACLLSVVAAQTDLYSRTLKKPLEMWLARTIAPVEQVRSAVVEVAAKGRRAFVEKRDQVIAFERRHFVDPRTGSNRRAELALPPLKQTPILTSNPNDRAAAGPKVNQEPIIRLALRPAQVASNFFWDRGAGTNFWTDAANWNPDGLPGSGDSLVFTNTGAGVVDLNGTTQPGSGAFGSLTFSNTTVGYTLQNGTINMGGNTLTLNSATGINNTISAQLNSTGAININGGTLVLTNAANNIAATTTLNGGWLQLGNGLNSTALSGVNAPVVSSAAPAANGGVAVTVANNGVEIINVLTLATLTGGAGGTNTGTMMGENGGGGDGGIAILFNGPEYLTNAGTITGGGGGALAGTFGGGPGASGGAGATAVVFTMGGSFNNSGTVRGGKGGDGSWHSSGNGGAGVSFTGSGDWSNTGSIFGGTGGNDLSGASSGGSGGIGVIFGSAGSWTNNGTIGGGFGGVSNNSGPGSGGIGVLLTNGGTLMNNVTINGGAGGSGSNGNAAGAGGTAVYFQAAGSLFNTGTITGANGGSLSFVGDGGAGGAGVFLNAGGSVTNSGTIQAGTGGSPGQFAGSPGAAGIGVVFTGAAGTLVNDNGGVINSGVVMGDFANNVTLQIGSTITGGLNMGTSTSATLTLTDNGNGGTQTYSSAVSGGTTFAGSLIKNGGGTWNLDQALTYTGGTNVNAGTLLVNNTSGSATGSGAVMVNSNATLGGNGTISGAVTVNNTGTLAPGNSPGQLHLGNNLTLNNGANLAIELGGLIAGSSYDQIQLAGALTLNTPNLLVSLINGFTPAVNDKFYLIDLTSTALALGTFANAPAGIYDSGGNYFLVNYFDTDPNDPGHTLANDISLIYLGMTPVPEPSTWVAAALAAGALVWMRRGRSRKRTPGRSQR